MSSSLWALLLAPLPFALVLAAVSDVRRFIIPNWTVLICAAGVLPALALSGLSFGVIAQHLAGGAGAFLIGFTFFALGLWGGGDGKLFAAAALWFDLGSVLEFIFWVAAMGGALGLAAIISRRFNTAVAPRYGLRPVQLGTWATHAPYGLAIAAGALSAFPSTALYGAYFG